MSRTFYTNVQVYGNNILYRGVKNGQRVSKKFPYQPKLYVRSQEPTKFTTIFGDFVAEMQPGSMKDCREFIDKYRNVENFPIYGQTRFEYSFINEAFPKEELDWSIDDVVVANIDIEVGSENGFPEPEKAEEKITAITVGISGKYYVFGCGDFTTTEHDVDYRKCRDEIDLINQFLAVWTLFSPDLVTGWNIKGFDIPYLVNRITKLLGAKMASKLSPWGILREKVADGRYGKQYVTYSLIGCSVIDYLELYIKYAPDGKSQERYTLDHIGFTELGERKLSYAEHGNLHNLYKKDFQKYIEYNIQDTRLVGKLNDKLRLLELALTLAYDGKFNYEDCFMQVRMWDVIIFNELMREGIIIPPNVTHSKPGMYEGAYVKEPEPDLYNWVVGFDLTSLYPSLIMMYNISPETILEPKDYPQELRDFISSNTINVENILNKKLDLSVLHKLNISMTPNGQFFRRDKEGFMPKITRKMFSDRQKYKDQMKVHKKELEKHHKINGTTSDDYRIRALISKYENLQLAKKVCLNSLYGATGSQYFRFFDLRIALAITTSGQLSIQWVQKETNSFINKLMGTTSVDYVIASDTDSMYLNIGPYVKKVFSKFTKTYSPKRTIKFMDRLCKYKIQPFIDDVYEDMSAYVNAFENKMNMKREALADKAIWTAKKRYIMNVYDNEGVEYVKPEIKVMGLEVRKSSTPGACRTKLSDAIEIIINKSEDDLINFINDFKAEFNKLDPEDIAFPRSINNISDYSSPTSTIYRERTPIHVRASLLYNHLVKKGGFEKDLPLIKEGEKIKFIYLKEPNHLRENVIGFPITLPKELDLHDYIDYNTQFEKSFLEPLKAILDVIGWKTKKIRTLKDFRT